MKHELVRKLNFHSNLIKKICFCFLGRTALHYAAVENNMNGALLLLKHGANIEAQDEHVSILFIIGKQNDLIFLFLF